MSGPAVAVTIGLPVYNGERFLAATVDSLLAQTFRDFELIISDNASTDATAQISRAYVARDPRVRYVRSPENRGASWNFNHVLGLSAGRYFKWAAADDICAPAYLARCVAALDTDPTVVLAYPQTGFIGAEGQGQGEEADPGLRTDAPQAHVRFGDLICSNHFCYQIFALMRASALRATALFGDFASADRVLLAELGLHGRFVLVPETLFFFRSHEGQSTRVYPTRATRAAWFDPRNAGRLLLPDWRIFLEYVRAVRRAPLSASERAACALHLVEWWGRNRNWARMGMDLTRAGGEVIRRTFGGRAAATGAGSAAR